MAKVTLPKDSQDFKILAGDNGEDIFSSTTIQVSLSGVSGQTIDSGTMDVSTVAAGAYASEPFTSPVQIDFSAPLTFSIKGAKISSLIVTLSNVVTNKETITLEVTSI